MLVGPRSSGRSRPSNPGWPIAFRTARTDPRWKSDPDPGRGLLENPARRQSNPTGPSMASGPTPPTDRYEEVEVEADLSGVSSIRLEALTDPSLPGKGPGRAAPMATSSWWTLAVIDEAEPSDQAGSPPRPAVSQSGFDVGGAIDGNSATGWAVDDRTGTVECGSRPGHSLPDRRHAAGRGEIPPDLPARSELRRSPHPGPDSRLSAGRQAPVASDPPEVRRRASAQARRRECANRA